MAMTDLGNGLTEVQLHEDALTVREAELSMLRRVGASEERMLIVQSNLANSYQGLRRFEQALNLYRDVYSGRLKLNGEEHSDTLNSAGNYGTSLRVLKRFKEAKLLLRNSMPVVRRVLGEGNQTTLRLRWSYAQSLYEDPGATVDDLKEAVTTLEEIERTSRRVFGSAHPIVEGIEESLRKARAALSATA